MSFDETNFDDPGSDAPLPEEANNNRTFFIAAGILGGIILISVACLAGIYLFGQQNRTTTATVDLTATVGAANNFINEALTATANAAILPTATSTTAPTAVVSVPTSTNTPDPALTAAAAGAGTPIAATATVGAALTQAAAAQLTVYPTTTALPNGGFADDIGLPGLVVMALTFVIVILLSRRLRAAPTLN